MGMSFASMQLQIESALGSECNTNKSIGLVAPYSSMELDHWIANSAEDQTLTLEEIWRYSRHLNLDDLDIGEEGIYGTLRRVLGRRGLVVWKVRRVCRVRPGEAVTAMMQRDW